MYHRLDGAYNETSQRVHQRGSVTITAWNSLLQIEMNGYSITEVNPTLGHHQ